MTIEELAERFFTLFRGLDRAHGVYRAQAEVEPGKKNEGSARTVHLPVTVHHWRRHLEGELGIGVVPVCADDTCTWGAIDVDVYPIDLVELQRKIARHRMPLLVARTKSGGAHLLVFFSEPVPSADVRAILTRWAKRLRFGTSEIFPKQVTTGDDGCGSWLNMPYQAGVRTLRYVLDPESCEALTPEEFLDLAYSVAIDQDAVDELLSGRSVDDGAPEPPADEDELAGDDPDLPGAPPCLVVLLRTGALAGFRNEVLFNLTTYFRRVDPATARERALTAASVFSPPLAPREAATTVSSALKRTYSYRCRNEPLVGVCDRATCVTRRYGIDSERNRDARTPSFEFGTLIRVMTDPPTWVWDVSGARIELTTDELISQRQFLSKVFAATGVLGKPMRPSAWDALIRERGLRAPQAVIPDDGTPAGRMWHALSRFCTSRARARNVDELLLGKPFTLNGRTYFTAPDFLTFCHRQGLVLTEKRLTLWLRERGLEHATMTLKGKRLPVWSVPEFDQQTEPFDAPQDPNAGVAF